MLHNCDFHTLYSHLEGDLIHVSGRLHSLVYADSPLPPPVGLDVIRDTVDEELPQLWPIKPTVDLLPKHVYDDEDKLTFKLVPALASNIKEIH